MPKQLLRRRDGRVAQVVAAAHYFATSSDQRELLDYLGEPQHVTLHPWPVVGSPPVELTRDQALARAQVMVVHRGFGQPSVIRPGDAAMDEPTKAGVFNRVNWDRLRPTAREGLVDSNVSPVLLWTPGETTGSSLRVSSIGSQADAKGAISGDYERWVNRVLSWVRRKGTKVWGLERNSIRPDLDVHLPFVNNVYALPGALSALEAGASGR